MDWRLPMLIIRTEDAMMVVIHTPRWFMLGKKDIKKLQSKFNLELES
jgi:hypothetical protein